MRCLGIQPRGRAIGAVQNCRNSTDDRRYEVLRSAASKLLRTQGFRVLEADLGVMFATTHPLFLKFKTCDGLLAFAGPSKSTYCKGKSFEVNNIFYRLRRGR
jgi:hypothetical protein